MCLIFPTHTWYAGERRLISGRWNPGSGRKCPITWQTPMDLKQTRRLPFQPCSCPWQGHRQRKISTTLWMASPMRSRERGWRNLAKMPFVKVSAGSWKTAPTTCWHDAVVLIRGRNSPLMTLPGSRTSIGSRSCPFWATQLMTLQSLCSGISAGS